jgi:hypothetical protein
VSGHAAGASARVLDRAAEWFVAPATDEPRLAPEAPAADHALRALVLGTPADAPPVAAALAGALRAIGRAPSAVAAAWCPAAGPARGETASLAFPAARRLTARLSARGLETAARGRLAVVTLPAEPGAAVAAARRTGAVDVPVVVALGGPRTPALEALLPDQDLIVVVAPDPAGPLARSALAGLSGRPAASLACRPLSGPPRQLALAGMGGARLLDPSLRAALRRLR